MFVLQLSANDFNDDAVCLGSQVAAVIELLVTLPEFAPSAWYAAWIDSVGADEDAINALKPYESSSEALIPDIKAFVALSRRVTQYLDGVFFAVPIGHQPQISDGIDKALDRFALNGIAEVRAWDTTCIEVATDFRTIVDRVQQRLGGNILVS